MPEFKTDHFKFYRVEINKKPGAIAITLRGQFDPRPRPHKVQLLTYFGNPVKKNQEPVHNPRTHLDWYALAGAHEPLRSVTIENQFERGTMVIGDPQVLLVPSWKLEPGQPKPPGVPTNLNHFKVYRILKHLPFDPRKVSLQDQFDREPVTVEVDAPMFFCVPVEKVAGKTKSPILNPKEHLTIYPITRRPYEEKRQVWDQFKGGILTNFRATFLAVPTLKRTWKALG